MKHASNGKVAVLLLVLSATTALSGCSGNDGLASVNTGSSALSGGEMAGGGIGAAAGGAAAAVAGADPTGVVGAVIAGLSAGVTAGGLLGGEPGPASDTFSAIDSLKSGESRMWRDPDDKSRIITTTVEDVFDTADGSLCKRYVEKRPADQGPVTSSGTACRKPGGSWHRANV